MPTDPQRMAAAESVLEARLRKHIADETGETRPIDIRFVWTGHRRGVVSYAYGDSPFDLRAAALAVEHDLADEIRRLEVGGPLPTDPYRHPLEGNGFTRAGQPEWVDLERIIEFVRVANENAEWNRQIEAVAEIAREAYDNGHGVIVEVHRSRNTVTAREAVRVVKGTAYVFDLDRINPTPDLTYLSRIDPKDLRP